MDSKLGKLDKVEYGLDDRNRLGLHFELRGDCWGTSWSEFEDITTILISANVNYISQLNGVPVEAIFENNILKSWRILTEVL